MSNSSTGKNRPANSRISPSVRGPPAGTVVLVVVVEAGVVVVVVDDVVVVGGIVVLVVVLEVVVVGGTVVVVAWGRVVVVDGLVDVVVVESGVVVVVGATVVVVESDPDSSSSCDWEARNRPSKARGSSEIALCAGIALEATAENDMLASRPAASPRSVGTVTSAGGVGASTDFGAKTANPPKKRAMNVVPAAMRKAKRRMK